jgi:Fe-S cluster assembly protein SufD
VFSGLIRVEREQKSNAHQTNRNLVLSEGAEAHSVPNLEIWPTTCAVSTARGRPLDGQRYYLIAGLDPTAPTGCR